MNSRFQSDVNVEEILASQYKASTKRNDKYVENMLQEFCSNKNFNYNDHSSPANWDNLLCEFYASVRKNDGTEFQATSLSSIRYSIVRLMKEKLNMDIVTNDTFRKSNSVHKAMQRKLKTAGKGFIKHFDVITDADLQKIVQMKWDSPVRLQWRVWVTLMIHFLNRGNENIHDMKKGDIMLSMNDKGKKCIQLRDFQTKNHQLMDGRKSTEAIIIETGDTQCPVRLIELYLKKLNPQNDFLWQRPRDSFSDEDEYWYENRKLGIHCISTFMSNISYQLQLSKKYTNHCLRATAITILGKKNFQDTEIAAFSGHKSLSSLSIYKRTSETVKENMSTALHESIAASSSSKPSTSPETTSVVSEPFLPETSFPENVPTSSTNINNLHSRDIQDLNIPYFDDADDLMLSNIMDELESRQRVGLTMFSNCNVNITNLNVTFTKK
jgi:hypothetical protein